MPPKIADQWLEAVKERRTARINAGYEKLLLDEIVKRLAALHDLEDWMVRSLLDAAIEEWESQVHHFRIEYDHIAAQNARRAEEARHEPDRRD
jgi:hypothetical protein